MINLNEARKLAGLPQLDEAAAGIVRSLNVKKLTVGDIQLAMEHAGYTDEFEGNTATVYGGWNAKGKDHVYYLMWENTEEEGTDEHWCISGINISIGESGFIEGEPDGTVVFSNISKDVALTKLKSYKKD